MMNKKKYIQIRVLHEQAKVLVYQQLKIDKQIELLIQHKAELAKIAENKMNEAAILSDELYNEQTQFLIENNL